jgi:hypothetical protein
MRGVVLDAGIALTQGCRLENFRASILNSDPNDP